MTKAAKPTTHVLFVTDPTAAVAWAAGLFEGEGSVSTRKSPSAKQRNARGARANLSMADRDVVERFAAIVGVGRIRYVHRAPPHSPMWRWDVDKWTDVTHVIDLLMPWMGPRRTAAMQAALANPPSRWQRQQCPDVPFPWGGGYQKHKRLGEPVCETCTESRRLLYRQRVAARRNRISLEAS